MGPRVNFKQAAARGSERSVSFVQLKAWDSFDPRMLYGFKQRRCQKRLVTLELQL